tara:strand:- start:5458 stop:5631 length:174 start_codon:yes stop_codon:yes gene_type:complete
MSTEEIFKILLPIVLIGMSFFIRKKQKYEGRIIKWWVLLVFGIILLILRLVKLFYAA